MIGADSAQQRKKYKNVANTRMVLLRRSLRASPDLAAIVHSLKVPAIPHGAVLEEYLDQVATLVMACPNLERLSGLYPSFDHNFSRSFHALSTRRQLREMTWVIAAAGPPMRPRSKSTSKHDRNQAQQALERPHDPARLQALQSTAFRDSHRNWSCLQTLTVHCGPGATLAPDVVLADTLGWLPALHTLHLSHLPATAFNDSSVTALPRLRKLSMVHMPGVSSAGLSAFATRAESRTIESLTLVHVHLDSLPALARVFANLRSLTSFAFVQELPPMLPADEMIWLFPYLASGSLTELHWDITDQAFGPSTADTILAKSIAAHGFPALTRLRTPADSEGIFQSLCKPRENVELPADRVRAGKYPLPVSGHRRPGSSDSSSTAAPLPPKPFLRTRTDSHGSVARPESLGSMMRRDSFGSLVPPGTPAGKSPMTPGFAPDIADLYSPSRMNSDLLQARLAAQVRLETARRFPRYFVNVTDEKGALVENFGMAGFIGDVGSRIVYHLLPDAGASDEKGGLVDVEDMLGDGGEDLAGSDASIAASGKITTRNKSSNRDKDRDGEAASTREGCTGRWNTYSGQALDKKDKERWWHTERGRWTGVTLS